MFKEEESVLQKRREVNVLRGRVNLEKEGERPI